MKRVLLAFLLLGGCTVQVVDNRVAPEAIADAFKQRDEAIKILSLKIKELREERKK